jgi:hypothetical protein
MNPRMFMLSMTTNLQSSGLTPSDCKTTEGLLAQSWGACRDSLVTTNRN